MTRLLLALFVKNYPDTRNPQVRSAIGSLAGITGIVCNVLLFLGKLICGLLAGSVSMVADAANNLSDAASSVVTLLGFRLARRPADADHPYGHARYEYLSALVVSIVIMLLGVELGRTSVSKILSPEAPDYSALALGILTGSIALKLWMWRFCTDLGKRIDSSVLLAAGTDSRNDCIATAGVLAGGLAARYLQINADGWIGLAVAGFILFSGIGIARETVSTLLGQQADPELVGKLSDLVLSHDKILGIHDLLVDDYGPGQCFASVHAEMSAREDSLFCHDIIDDIECDALAELNVHLVIHYDPVMEGDCEWDAMSKSVDQAVFTVSPRLSVHDFRMVRGARQTKLVFDLAIPYEMHHRRRELRDEINAELNRAGIPYGTVIHFDGKA